MAYVVTSACIGVKDLACIKVCPIDCFYDAGEQVVIDPNACNDCGLCAFECPVQAIFRDEDVPEAEAAYIERNAHFFKNMSPEEWEAFRMRA
ncbi:MAG: ferredoxin family protein [Planctomycetes bacterium]|nr:ferredoxin family protein [Planctomycetota bacterium]